MSTGRIRLEIGTYGDISTKRTPSGTVRAEARFRDWDGEVRKVTATANTSKAAKQALRQKLAQRSTAAGLGSVLTPESTMAQLASAWLEDVEIRTDLADGTKDLYRREVNSLVLPYLKSLRLREVTVGRVDQFIKRQAITSYAHAKHSRRMLSMMFNFALRHDAIHHNPVAGAARLKAPNKKPQSLTYQQIEQVRNAATTWRTGKSVCGPRPDGQVRGVIEVLLGSRVGLRGGREPDRRLTLAHERTFPALGAHDDGDVGRRRRARRKGAEPGRVAAQVAGADARSHRTAVRGRGLTGGSLPHRAR